MKITFVLAFAKRSHDVGKSFKSNEYQNLFAQYTQRLKPLCTAVSIISLDSFEKTSAIKIWVCHTSKEAKQVSTQQLSDKIRLLRDGSVKELAIVIGPANGFSSQDIEKLKPEFIWSFGYLTYPHELAAVITSEQIYRAYSILHKLPYHLRH